MQSRDDLKLPEAKSLNKSGTVGYYSSTRNSARSLNMFRKREEDRRIEQENLKLAKKIYEIRPSITAKEQIKDWKYSKNCSERLR